VKKKVGWKDESKAVEVGMSGSVLVLVPVLVDQTGSGTVTVTVTVAAETSKATKGKAGLGRDNLNLPCHFHFHFRLEFEVGAGHSWIEVQVEVDSGFARKTENPHLLRLAKHHHHQHQLRVCRNSVLSLVGGTSRQTVFEGKATSLRSASAAAAAEDKASLPELDLDRRAEVGSGCWKQKVKIRELGWEMGRSGMMRRVKRAWSIWDTWWVDREEDYDVDLRFCRSRPWRGKADLYFRRNVRISRAVS
jgi:hypothetical protein